MPFIWLICKKMHDFIYLCKTTHVAVHSTFVNILLRPRKVNLLVFYINNYLELNLFFFFMECHLQWTASHLFFSNVKLLPLTGQKYISGSEDDGVNIPWQKTSGQNNLPTHNSTENSKDRPENINSGEFTTPLFPWAYV